MTSARFSRRPQARDIADVSRTRSAARGPGRAACIVGCRVRHLVVGFCLLLGVVLLATPVLAQTPSDAETKRETASPPNLIERYQAARQHVLVQQMLRGGRRGVPPLSLSWIASPVDSLRPAPPLRARRATETDTTGFDVVDVRRVRKLERGWFERRFASTRWSFLGAGRYFTPFDTTMTRELRARLQAQFGDPTQTPVDADDLRKPPEDVVQFEYWFVVNDSIPVKVSDANGPYDRGLIVAADARYRDRLYALRQALLRPVHRAERRPYVDYYYDASTRRWYRAGFDGRDFFVERTYRSQIIPGRRPRLDPARVDTSAAPSGASVRRPPRP